MGMLAARVSEVTAVGGLSGDARRIRAEQWFAEVLVGSVSVLAVPARPAHRSTDTGEVRRVMGVSLQVV